MDLVRATALVLATLAAVVIPAAAPAAETTGPPSASEPLYWHVDPDGDGPTAVGDVVEHSAAEIWRDASGISFRIRTTGLQEGHAVTVWFFSYDNPDACLTGDGNEGTRCTIGDFFNPASFPSIMWGAGQFVSGDEITTFTGRRESPSSPCLTEPVVVDDKCSGVLLGHGLHNPMGAEIHFTLRDHGPDQDGVDDETTTINGGCDPATHAGMPVFGPGWGTPGDYPCYDPQGNN